MKLKDLMNNYNGPLLIFIGDYFIGNYFTGIIKDVPHERIAKIICLESDKVISLEDTFKTPEEKEAVSKRVFECANLDVNKMFTNDNGELVVFVK